MSFEVIVTKAAQTDAEDAYSYYESQQEGLGERFLQSLLKRYADLSSHPHHYGFIDEDSLRIFRDVRLEIFPLSIIFEIIERKVIVHAIHHFSRNPVRKLRKS